MVAVVFVVLFHWCFMGRRYFYGLMCIFTKFGLVFTLSVLLSARKKKCIPGYFLISAAHL